MTLGMELSGLRLLYPIETMLRIIKLHLNVGGPLQVRNCSDLLFYYLYDRLVVMVVIPMARFEVEYFS